METCETPCPPFNLNLRIKITADEPQPVKEFPLQAWAGQSLLNVLKVVDGNTLKFEFKDDVPDSGPYVVAVMLKGRKGKNEWFRNEGDLFWQTVLYNDASKEKIKPIDLHYRVCENDTVSLKFSYF